METAFQSFINSSIFYVLLLITAALVLYHFYKESSRYVKLGRMLPGPLALPIIGHLYLAGIAILLDPADLARRILEEATKVNDVVGGWLGYSLYVALRHPSDIEVILSSNVNIKKADEYQMFQPWLGDGLLISEGEKWKYHRKLIAPTFHMNVLKSFVPTFNKLSQNAVDALRCELHKEFDAHDYMSSITVDILLNTVMGVRESETGVKINMKHSSFDYAKAVMSMCDILHRRHYKLWLRLPQLFNLTGLATKQMNSLNIIHTLSTKVMQFKKGEYFRKKLTEKDFPDADALKTDVKLVEDKPKLFQDSSFAYIRDDLDENDDDVGEKKRLPFLDFMTEVCFQEGSKLTESEVKENVDTLMFEGHDTTAAASSFALCLLGIHQDIQRKVMDEQNEIFKGTDRLATFTDTIHMKYLERVILETLRLYPPVPFIARKLTEEAPLVSGDYILPVGTTVLIATYLLHRRPEIYPNPEQFDPDNFLPEKCANRPYYGFIPFSAGPRSCVGRKYAMLKLKILLSHILRNYKINSNMTEADFKVQGDIILKLANGFNIKIEPREKYSACA